MKAAVALLLVTALATPPALQRIVRESNSATEAKKGMAAWGAKKYAEAARDFAVAGKLSPSARAAFDEATARAAAGDLAGAAPLFELAARDPQLRRDVLFNRGTSELSRKEYDAAVRDLASALRLSSNDAEAKRNLELALQRKAEGQQQRQSTPNGGGSGGNSPSQHPNSKPGTDPNGKPDPHQLGQSGQQQGPRTVDPIDSILKSVQEQEKEELSRMRGSREEQRAVGW